MFIYSAARDTNTKSICHMFEAKASKVSLLTLVLRISLINGEYYHKSQRWTKHGVENGIATAKSDTLDAKCFQNLVFQ